MAAPATSSLGKPRRPKIKMGSITMLMAAPTIWEIMESLVRPVACSSRSRQNWLKRPMEAPRQMPM